MAIGLGTAIIGSAILGGAGSVASGIIGSNAASNAQQAQENTAQQQLQLQSQIYNQQRSDFEPYRQFGLAAMPQLAGLLGIAYNPQAASPSQVGVGGLGGSSFADGYFGANPDVASAYSSVANGGFGPNLPATYDYNGNKRVDRDEFAQFHYDRFGASEGRQTSVAQQQTGGGAAAGGASPGAVFGGDIQSYLENTPGYQFALSQGTRAVDAGAANSGLVNSGARAKALTEFGQGLASQTLTQERNALFNALNVGTGASAQVAQAGQNYAGNASNTLTNLGNAQAQGALNRGSAFSNAIGGVTNTIGGAVGLGAGLGVFNRPQTAAIGAGSYYGGGMFSDPELKDNVERVGEIGGMPLYSWTWNDKAKELGLVGSEIGFMADEIEAINPAAVVRGPDGYRRILPDAVFEGMH